MRKTFHAALIVAVIACAVALPVAAAAPGDSHCTTLAAGLYVGVQAGIATLLALLALVLVARYGMVTAVRVGGVTPIVIQFMRAMPSWIPPPVLLAAAAVDDPQIFNRGVVGSLLRASA